MTALRHLFRHAGIAALLISSFTLSTPSWSDGGSEHHSALSWHGFGTLGFAHSSNDQAEFVRDLSQPQGISNQWSGRNDSVLGLQANYQVTYTLEAVAQVISRYHAEANSRPELAWAFLKYEPNAYLSLRGGRIGTDFFMGADSRLIGYSYLTVRPPPDYFAVLPFSYFDGGDIQLSTPLSDGVLRAKVYSGWTREKIPVSTEYLDIDGAPMAGGFLDYARGPWIWRASYAQIRFNHDLPQPMIGLRKTLTSLGSQAAAIELALSGWTSRYYSAGVMYDEGPLQLQAMVNRIQHESKAFEDSGATTLLAGYRIGQFTPFAGYSWVTSQAKKVATGLPNVGQLATLNAGVVRVMADSHSEQNTMTLGLRWDVHRNMALKVQADAIRGVPESIFNYRRETPLWNGRTNILSISLDFIF